MKKREIIRYFQTLAHAFPYSCTVILTGAGAGSIYGNVRATMDLDFALKLKTRTSRKKARLWQEFADQTVQVSRRTGIAAQYAEDIDRWSAITFLDYAKHTRPFRKFGKIEVRLMDPAYWSIGKLTRYLALDIRDLVDVLKKTKTPSRKLSRLMGRALLRSPRSTACFSFRRQVEHFLSAQGPKIWGKRYVSAEAIRIFHTAAKIR